MKEDTHVIDVLVIPVFLGEGELMLATKQATQHPF